MRILHDWFFNWFTVVRNIWGNDGSLYLTKIKLTPRTRWGQLWFYIFHRPDNDRHMHDHPWNFWTFPLQGYIEKVPELDEDGNWDGVATRSQVVSGWCWTKKFATHIHLVDHAERLRLPDRNGVRVHHNTVPLGLRRQLTERMYTFMWTYKKTRSWGFWVNNEWVPWADYVGHRGAGMNGDR